MSRITRWRLNYFLSAPRARHFTTCRKGNVAIIFGLSLAPLMMLVGGAVDYGRVLLVRSTVQSALDSATLAGGREFQMTSDATAARTKAESFFTYRFQSGKGTLGSPHLTQLSVDQSSYTLTAKAEADVPTPFLSVAGIPSVKIAVESQSGLALGGTSDGQDLEVSMMIDVTGSMTATTASGNTKIADAKLAAKDLIDILMPTGYSGGQTARIALVPFSQYVNVGRDYYKKVTNYDPPGSGSTCVTERTGADKYTDAAPGGTSYIGRYTVNSNQGTLSCAPVANLMPLTTDKTGLKNAVDGLSAAGWTAGHLGTAWAWYVLSEKWAGIWPQGSVPGTPNAKLKKVAVLMTDGDYNTYYRNSTASQTQATNLCNGMKAAGITVYTIAFGTDLTSTARTFLQSCASTTENFYDAADGDELRAAFRTIAFQLSQLRLTQ